MNSVDKTTEEVGWAEREVPFFQPGFWGVVQGLQHGFAMP